MVFAKGLAVDEAEGVAEAGVVAEFGVGVEGEMAGPEREIVVDEELDEVVVEAGDALEGVAPADSVVADDKIRSSLDGGLEKRERGVDASDDLFNLLASRRDQSPTKPTLRYTLESVLRAI